MDHVHATAAVVGLGRDLSSGKKGERVRSTGPAIDRISRTDVELLADEFSGLVGDTLPVLRLRGEVGVEQLASGDVGRPERVEREDVASRSANDPDPQRSVKGIYEEQSSFGSVLTHTSSPVGLGIDGVVGC